MARILALDTSTTACSVAVDVDGRIVEDFVLAPQDHTQRLLPMVDQLLTSQRLSLHNFDAIAFAQGPGSFTGLRICVGVVQGLAFGADLPVIPVSTLEAMTLSARRLLQLKTETVVLPALDARMGEIYWGVYQLAAAGQRIHRMLADRVDSPGELIHTLSEQEIHRELHIVGGACPLVEPPAGARIHPDLYPHAQDVARIAQHLWEHGETLEALDARPAYIRNEVSWAKRQRIRS